MSFDSQNSNHIVTIFHQSPKEQLKRFHRICRVEVRLFRHGSDGSPFNNPFPSLTSLKVKKDDHNDHRYDDQNGKADDRDFEP